MIERGKLVKIVGAGNITYEQDVLDAYSSDISFVNAVKPICVVKPQKAGDIQKIVKLANETQTPLVPVSSGPPHFRGDTVPGIGGAIVVDLSGIKKIIRVDRYHRVAMVEPGVTFDELIQAAAKKGIRLNMPLLPRRSKTVVGSLLEREPVIMPKYQWDVSDPLACVGVVWGTGDEFRTGQAAGPGTIKEQWAAGGAQKAPYGPGSIAWHRLIQGAQGTMGIVTWASMRCELLPSLEEPFIVTSPDLDIIFELSQLLVKRRLVNECFILNNTNLAAIFAKRWSKAYQSIKGALPSWILFYNVAGYEYMPQDRVNYQIKDITEITQWLGVEAVKSAGGISANEILKTVQQPSAEPYWKLRYKGACEDIFFLSIYKKLDGQIEAMYDLVEKADYPSSEMGVYIQPMVQGTSVHCEFNLFYDPENSSEANRVRGLSTAAVKALLAGGAFFSRPYGVNAGMIVNRDAATVTALTRIKRILDPKNIMNPGKLYF